MENLSAEIVAVGTELLLGDILNTNAQFLSRELSLLGFNVYFQTVVGDNPKRLSDSIGLALSRADVVITSGGLGPTDDDLTKETVAHHLSLELIEDEESISFIRDFFKKRDSFPKSNLKQGLIPKGAKAIKNDNGTAPGVYINKGEKTVIMLPGPPNELVPMFNDKVKPYLEKMTGATICSETLRVFGIGESQVAEILSDLMEKSNPTLAPYAKTGEVTLRLTAKAENKEEAKKQLEPLKEEVIKRLGDFVYSTEDISLAQTVLNILNSKKLNVATAESCTAGKLSASVTDCAGASSAFNMGVVTYSNDAKEKLLGVKHKTLSEKGAVSEETAREMAEGIRALAKSDIGIGITGIAGPEGGSEEKPVGLVYVGVASKNGVFAKKLNLWGDRNKVRTLAVLNALDLIRREAMSL